MSTKRTKDVIKQAVKEHYGAAISQAAPCCGGTTSGPEAQAMGQYAQLAGYGSDQLAGVPSEVVSFGCGNPVNFINVKEGEVVLDLGSGAGLDLILAARKVGTSGKVIGLDMTPEMVEACRRNLVTAGVTNAEVRVGEMEKMPVADAEVDWIISNCVINLSPEKERVFAEAFRVLRPGGQMLVSDIVTANLPESVREELLAWVGCIAGAVEETEYLRLVQEAGFVNVRIVDKMTYSPDSLTTLAGDSCCGGKAKPGVAQALLDNYAATVASIKLYAQKPEAGTKR